MGQKTGPQGKEGRSCCEQGRAYYHTFISASAVKQA